MIIGLSGPKHCGKSTIAAMLQEKYNYHRVSLSTPIQLMEEAFLRYQNVSEDRIQYLVYGDGRDTEVVPELGWQTSRWFQQTIGTDWGRNLMHSDLWINAFIRSNQFDHKNIVFENVRFPNEAEFIRSYNGFIIRILRPSLDNNDQHASETLYLDIEPDFSIHNTSTIEAMLTTMESTFNLNGE